MPNKNVATIEVDEPTAKEKAVYYLKTLIELIENDQVRADRISGLTADEVIELAEAEAAKAVEESEKLMRE